jgi:CheY-like chemotaxis protein
MRIDHHQAITASSGFAALNTLKGCPVDLVLTDFQMPGMNGLDLARRIKEMPLDMPIVMMTGLSGADVDDMLTAGIIDEILLKPFSVEAVNRLLMNLLAEHFRSFNYA